MTAKKNAKAQQKVQSKTENKEETAKFPSKAWFRKNFWSTGLATTIIGGLIVTGIFTGITMWERHRKDIDIQKERNFEYVNLSIIGEDKLTLSSETETKPQTICLDVITPPGVEPGLYGEYKVKNTIYVEKSIPRFFLTIVDEITKTSRNVIPKNGFLKFEIANDGNILAENVNIHIACDSYFAVKQRKNDPESISGKKAENIETSKQVNEYSISVEELGRGEKREFIVFFAENGSSFFKNKERLLGEANIFKIDFFCKNKENKIIRYYSLNINFFNSTYEQYQEEMAKQYGSFEKYKNARNPKIIINKNQ